MLDVVYREDDSRIRRGNGEENVALIRRLCMNLARWHLKKNLGEENGRKPLGMTIFVRNYSWKSTTKVFGCPVDGGGLAVVLKPTRYCTGERLCFK